MLLLIITGIGVTTTAQAQKVKTFAKPQYSVNFIGLTSLQNETEFETLISGIQVKAQGKNLQGTRFLGGEGHYLKASFKDEGSFIHDTRFGGGIALSFFNQRTNTDVLIGVERLERKADIRQSLNSWEEKQNNLYLSLCTNWYSNYEGGFKLSEGELFIYYYYPLSGEKTFKSNGRETQRGEASNSKFLYLGGSLGFFPQRLSTDWALTPYFKLGYDHQSWNKGDYYSPGIGFRIARKRIEFLNAWFENRFKSSGSNSGEPRVGANLNVLALFDL